MLRNNPIKNKTETIGFLLITIDIPHNIDTMETIISILELKLFVKVSLSIHKLFIKYTLVKSDVASTNWFVHVLE